MQHYKHWQRRYNRNRRDLACHIGDLVYVQVHTGHSKLDVRRFGPCTIIQTSGQQHYLVRNNITGQSDWCHVSQLYPIIKHHPH